LIICKPFSRNDDNHLAMSFVSAKRAKLIGYRSAVTADLKQSKLLIIKRFIQMNPAQPNAMHGHHEGQLACGAADG